MVYLIKTVFFFHRLLVTYQVETYWYCNIVEEATAKDVLFMTRNLDQYQSVKFKKMIFLENSWKGEFLLDFKVTSQYS